MQLPNYPALCTLCFILYLSPAFGQWEEYWKPNEENCGTTEEIAGDVRTASPWTVAIYVRKNLRSPFQYFLTGSLMSATTVLTAFGGGYGQPPYTKRNRKYFIPSPSHYLIATGLRSTDLDTADEFSQFANVSFVLPCKANSTGDEEYHMVMFHLEKPLNTASPYVRALCQPFAALPYFRSLGLQGRFSDILMFSADIEEAFISGFDAPIGAKENFVSTFLEVTSANDVACLNSYRYYYRTNPDEIFCMRILPERGLSDSICLTHGSQKTFRPSKSSINNTFFRPERRYYSSGVISLIPRRDRGQCGINTTYVLINIWSGIDWIKRSMSCDPQTYPCANGKCIPLDMVCDGKPDCSESELGEDEDPIYCKATRRCKGQNSYQCGLEGKCISGNQVGDGVSDCPSGTDEDPWVIQTKLSTQPKSRPARTNPCAPLRLTPGVIATCYHPEMGKVDCLQAPPGTQASLHCGKYYTSLGITDSVSMNCYDDETWKPFKPFACQSECGLFGYDIQPLVVGGREIKSKQVFPWHAAILKESKAGSYENICGASLIERDVLLTAAHCTTDSDGVPYNTSMLKIVFNSDYDQVSLSEYQEDDDALVFEVEETWRPWSYNAKTLESDLAVIKLAEPVTYTQTTRPVCYLMKKFNKFPPTNSTGAVPGFGVTETGKVSRVLKYVNLKVVAATECDVKADESFCARSSKVGDGLCYGDSGGGFVFPSDTSENVTKYLLKGVVSTYDKPKGTWCGQGPSSTSGFTHIDSHSEWLLTILQSIYSNFDS